MPTRILRDGILTSERVNELGAVEEVFYRRLMSVVDDHGRFYGNPALIRAACFPLKLDKVSDSDIGKWLLVTEKAGLVRQYLATDGKRYLQLIDFGQRVQAKSKFPSPDDEPQKFTVIHGGKPEDTVNNGLVVGEDGVEDEGVSPTKRRKSAISIPADFGVSERVKAWAKAKGHIRLDDHLESFIGKAIAKDYRYADWDVAFMNAIREDWAKLGSSQKSTVNIGDSSAARKAL
jgi:hypothetical protein